MSHAANLDLICRLLSSFRLGRPELGARSTNFSVRQLDRSTRMVSVQGVWHFVTDNGGELNVEVVNGEFLAAVPLTHFSRRLNEATVAQRVARVLRGEEVDYATDAELSDDEQRLLALAI